MLLLLGLPRLPTRRTMTRMRATYCLRLVLLGLATSFWPLMSLGFKYHVTLAPKRLLPMAQPTSTVKAPRRRCAKKDINVCEARYLSLFTAGLRFRRRIWNEFFFTNRAKSELIVLHYNKLPSSPWYLFSPPK